MSKKDSETVFLEKKRAYAKRCVKYLLGKGQYTGDVNKHSSVSLEDYTEKGLGK